MTGHDETRILITVRTLAALALIALGAISLSFGDLLLQWQPVPAGAPWRHGAALGSGTLLIVSGLALAWPRTARIGAAVAASWIGLWVIALHIPVAVSQRFSVVALLGVAESGAMALGLASTALRPTRATVRAISIASGCCMIVFGISHFAYLKFTASMVPAWLPARTAIAALTGFVHAAAGVCLVIGFRRAAAAAVEAGMMASFVLLLHVPGVFGAPGDRLQLTMLAVAWLLAGATALSSLFYLAAGTAEASEVR